MKAPADQVVIASFIERLRANNFPVNVDHYLRSIQLLTIWQGQFTPSRLRTLLCPVFASNADEQRLFYDLFDRHFPHFGDNLSSLQSGDPSRVLHTRDADKNWANIVFNAMRVGFVVLLICAATIFEWNRHFGHYPVGHASQVITPATNPGATQPPVGTQASEALGSTKEGSYEPPSNRPRPEPVATASGTGKAPPINDKVPSNADETPRNADQTPPQADQIVLVPIASGISLSWIVPILLVLLWAGTEIWIRVSRLIVLTRRGNINRESSIGPPKALRVLSRVRIPFSATLRKLRLPVPGQLRLSLSETISGTVRSAGFPDFRFVSILRRPQYLALIDRASSRDHQAIFFDECVKTLDRHGLRVAPYYFRGDVRICENATNGRRIYLADLAGRTNDHRLLLFSEGDQLVSENGGLIKGAHLLLRWHSRTILTPREPKEWGHSEFHLARHFLLLPATASSLAASVDYFDPEYRSFFRRPKTEFDTRRKDIDRASTLEIREFLGSADLYDWLCACALYPQLQWDVTLRLGEKLNPDLLTERNLEKLVSLPWFRRGYFSLEIQQELAESLDSKRRRRLRAAIVDLLTDLGPEGAERKPDVHKLEIAMQIHDILPNERRTFLEDETIALVVAAHNIPSQSVDVPTALRNRLFPLGIPPLGLRRGVRSTILAVILLHALFSMQIEMRDRIDQSNERIRQQKDQLADLNELDRALGLEEASLKSPDRIDAIARRFGLVPMLDVPKTLIKLGDAQAKSGEMVQAEGNYLKALNLYRQFENRNPGAFRLDVAGTLSHVGDFYRNTLAMEKAQACYQESLSIFRELATSSQTGIINDVRTNSQTRKTAKLSVAKTLNKFGEVLSDEGRMGDAEGAYQEALALYRQLGNKESTALTLNSLGTLYADTGRLKEAEVSYLQALSQIRQRAGSHPESNPDIAMVLETLGRFYSRNDRIPEGERSYRQALDIYNGLAQTNPAYKSAVARVAKELKPEGKD